MNYKGDSKILKCEIVVVFWDNCIISFFKGVVIWVVYVLFIRIEYISCKNFFFK